MVGRCTFEPPFSYKSNNYSQIYLIMDKLEIKFYSNYSGNYRGWLSIMNDHNSKPKVVTSQDPCWNSKISYNFTAYTAVMIFHYF